MVASGTTRPHVVRHLVSLLTVLALALALAVGLTTLATAPAHAIYNGKPAQLQESDSLVVLHSTLSPTSLRCGGVLVASDIVLTAAHCVAWLGEGEGITVHVGKPKVADWTPETAINVASIVVHPKFATTPTNEADVALLKLEYPVPNPTVRIATREPWTSAKLKVLGWGCQDKAVLPQDYKGCQKPSTRLMTMTAAIQRDKACQKPDYFQAPEYYAPSVMCLWDKKSVPSYGDSGSPLLGYNNAKGTRRGVVYGIVSGGTDVITNYWAATSVAVYSRWIKDTMVSLRDPS